MQVISEINPQYVFDLPEPPKLNRIFGSELHVADQFWKRPYTLTDRQFEKLSYSEQEEIAEIEDDRCINGFWFMNHGKPVWLTGDAYFWLTHWTGEGKNPKFIYNQLLWFYFYRYCELDPKCFGSIELKPRQVGSTSTKLCIFVNRGIRNEYLELGILSKTAHDAKNVNFGQLQQGFNALPHWMKPKVKTQSAATELAFEQPAIRGTQLKKKKDEEQDYYLNTTISWRSSTIKSYDGAHLTWLIFDEYFKWNDTNAYLSWKTHRRCLGDIFNIWGKAFLLSTVGVDDKEEKISDEAIQNGTKLWNESNPDERDGNGFTMSGLYRWFIPSYTVKPTAKNPKSGEALLDKYGQIKEDVIKYVILNDRSTKDARQRLISMREDPMNAQEALQTMGGSATFDNSRLGERLTYLENFEPTIERPVKYRKVNLSWLNNQRFTKVIWHDNPNGLCEIAYLPNIAGADKVNRVKKIGEGMFAPFSDTQFVMGMDSFIYDETVSGEGSKGGLKIKLKNNFANEELSNIYCLSYCARPSTLEQFFEHAIMVMWLYGAKVNVERLGGGSRFISYCKQNGLMGFLMNRPESTKVNSKSKDTLKGTPTSTDIITAGCESIENYIAAPNLELNENQKDNLNYFWFDKDIKDLMDFNPSNTEKYDRTMAMIMTELGAQALQKYIPKTETKKENILDHLFPLHINGDLTNTITREEYGKRNGQGLPKTY